MKFYLVKVLTYNDGKDVKKALYEYDDEVGAIASFHSELASAMNDKTVATALITLLNDANTVIKKEPTFVRPVEVEPAPEPETEA